MSPRVSHQLAASLAARLLSGGLQFLLTPVYVSLLGIESYGLVGFYLVLVGTLLFLDQAVSPAVTRQFAASNHDDALRARLPNILRTMEWVTVGMGLLVAIFVAIAAPFLAKTLLNPASISIGEAVNSIRVMALMIAVQWPSFSYAGALAGLGQQVRLNGARATFASLQWCGGAVILWVHADVTTLFIWQAICFAMQTITLAIFVHTLVDRSESAPPKFDRTVIRESWRFGVGVLSIGILGTVLTQADKIVVMRHSSLSDFSVYSLTFTIASLIQVFVAQPVMAIAYPHFSSLIVSSDEQRLATEYCNWTQAVVMVVVPITAVFVFFPEPLIRLWLAHNLGAVDQCLRYLPWVASGTMFNVIMMLPLNLQLASGWTQLSSIKNALIVPFFLIALLFGIPRYGARVGAVCWFSVNFIYYLIEIPIMHRRLLKSTLWTWWIAHTLRPTAAVAIVLAAFATVVRFSGNGYSHLLVTTISAWLMATLIIFYFSPFPRQLMSDFKIRLFTNA